MKVRGMVQSSEASELTAEADDAETARALVEEQVPATHELLQVHNAMPRGGRVIATAVIRPAGVTEIEAQGADYAAARDALRAQVAEGQRLLSITIVED
jgi:peptidyl-tRNA hydrolase